MTTASAKADLRSGRLLAVTAGASDSRLEDLAAAAGEMLATDEVCWDLVFGQIGGTAGLSGFNDLVLISADSVYVIQRSEGRSAFMGVAKREGSIGLVISSTRERFQEL